jgi:hypothetical protein
MRGCLGFTILISSLIIAANSAAQDRGLLLRAGEHDAFTRVVLTLPEQVPWRLDNQGSYIDLIIEDSSILIDLSQTFTRIPRTRLRAVEAIETGVRLMLACRCPVRTIEGLPGQVILDILSESAMFEDDASDVGQTPKPRPKTIPQVVESISPLASIAGRAGIALAKTMKGDGNAATSSGLALSFSVSANNAGSNSPPKHDTPVSQGAQPLEQTLARNLSEAAAANLLLPAQDFAPRNKIVAEISDVAARHIQMYGHNDQRLIKPDDQSCTNAVSAQIPGWNDLSGKTALNLRWENLFDPLDNINAKEATAIATNYLLGSFGAEARAILTLLPRTKAIETMLDLSHVMDLEYPS